MSKKRHVLQLERYEYRVAFGCCVALSALALGICLSVYLGPEYFAILFLVLIGLFIAMCFACIWAEDKAAEDRAAVERETCEAEAQASEGLREAAVEGTH